MLGLFVCSLQLSVAYIRLKLLVETCQGGLHIHEMVLRASVTLALPFILQPIPGALSLVFKLR